MAKAYYNAHPNRRPIPLGMPSGIATEFKNTNQTAKGGSNSGVLRKERRRKNRNRQLRRQMVSFTTTEVCAANVFATTSVRGRGEGLPQCSMRHCKRMRSSMSTGGRGKLPQERSYGTPSAGPPSTLNNEGSKQNPLSNSQGRQHPLPRQGNGYDLLPCLFCGQHQHPARSSPAAR